ncbi:Hypothetical predicted protein [Podarcis lilfordi]|uniref:Uncharacterized protein n=1 Tax=Podarcis lilfordi TaxID=74358 RepID=A0AA35PGP9_9SAUR|nr:Hypothetical predicted protein [Podarcis lilfordi]
MGTRQLRNWRLCCVTKLRYATEMEKEQNVAQLLTVLSSASLWVSLACSRKMELPLRCIEAKKTGRAEAILK